MHFERYTQNLVKQALLDTPAIFIMGARQTGKTTLAKSLSKSAWRFINLDNETQLNLIKNDPIGFINALNEPHVVIDEIQRLPNLLLAIKQSIDETRKPGRFILTGSANAMVLPKVSDSLAGRIESIQLSPLSECEINHTKPTFLSKLIHTETPKPTSKMNKDYLINRIVTGCYPEPVQRKTASRVRAWYKQYINSLIQKDIRDLEHIDHPDKMIKLLKLAAYYSSKLINFSEISSKIGLNSETTKKYLHLIEHLFLLTSLPAWHTNEYKRLVKTPKIYMNDTGLACAIRDISKDTLLANPIESGPLVETFVINELRKQASWIEQDLTFSHYRDKDKNEVDCIIENSQGDCFAIEIKASATLSNQSFYGLKRFKEVAKHRFKSGILLYTGHEALSLNNELHALPINTLWD